MPVLKVILFSLLGMILFIGSTTTLYAQAPPSQEYQVKAVFLYNFTQFVEWPDSAFATENAPLVIGILGKDPFGAYLDEVVADEKVKGHPIIVQRYEHLDEMRACHILFIQMVKKDQTRQIMSALKNKSILTVCEGDGFMQQGGAIRFITVNKKIRFQINPEVAKTRGLHISSKLLSLAEIFSIKQNN